jgi:hypothetical protein
VLAPWVFLNITNARITHERGAPDACGPVMWNRFNGPKTGPLGTEPMTSAKLFLNSMHYDTIITFRTED